MKFAHMADCHIGSWRDPRLAELSTRAFEKAIRICIAEQVDFVLIAGDLFNTSFPAIDRLKSCVQCLKQLKDSAIACYAIAGSHDFSPSGKTMLEVLESAGLLVNVLKGDVADNRLRLRFTQDKKTNAMIAGMLGKRGTLEKKYYESLVLDNLEQEGGYKIFLFHSALAEYKPDELEHADALPVSFLPKNFQYYAGGHVHYVRQFQHPVSGTICYPGPLFPNNFKELEELKHGGFYIVNEWMPSWIPVKLFDVHPVALDCSHKTPAQAELEISSQIEGMDFSNTIVTFRLHGTLAAGKTSDIDFRGIFERVYAQGAYFAMKNTSKLGSSEFQEIVVDTSSAEEIEQRIIREHLQQIQVRGFTPEKEEGITKNLLAALASERQEGERVIDFEERIIRDGMQLLELE